MLHKYEFPSSSLFIYLPANLLAKTSETQTRWLLSGNREELSAPPHLPSRPQICRLSLQQELQPRARWWSICFANVILSQHWFLMGRDQYPELLCSQTLQKKTHHTSWSRSIIRMNDHPVQYCPMLQRRLANILEQQVWTPPEVHIPLPAGACNGWNRYSGAGFCLI